MSITDTPVVHPSGPPTKEIGQAGTGILPWTGIIDVAERVPELAFPQSIPIYEAMRHDAQVAGIMHALTLPIRRYTWMIDPAGARPEVTNDIASQMGLPIKGADNPTPPRRVGRQYRHDDHLRHALL